MPAAFLLRLPSGRAFPVQGEVRAGSEAPCEIIIDEASVAPLHLTFWVDRDALFIRDEASPTGAFVNETRLPPGQPCQLFIGDLVRLGSATLTVAEAEAAEPDPPPVEAAPASATTPPAPTAEAYALRGIDGRTYYISGEMRLGRDPTSSLFLPDTWVSRQHALFWVDGGTLYVRDEQSRAGTFVNEARLAPGQPTALRPGDKVRVGVTTLEVEIAPDAPTRPPVAPTMMARRPSQPDPTGPFVPVTGLEPHAPAFDFGVRLPDGLEVRIEGELRLGRQAPCEVVLSDPLVSDLHATLWIRKGVLYVRDEMSSNGTLVNGYRIVSDRPYPLRVGDEVQMGDSVFAVIPGGQAAPLPPPPAEPPPARAAWDKTITLSPPAPVAEPPTAMAFMLVTAGGAEYVVAGELRIGRDLACEVVLTDPLVSRLHAVALVQGDELFVRDEGSRNGTFVAGARLAPGQLAPLRPGDQFRVGDTPLTVGLTPRPA